MGILISISGFDGVGKTTQVNLLLKYLQGERKKVYVTEEMFGYYLLKPLIKNLRSATGSLPGGPVRRNKKSLPKLWFIPAYIDIWLMFIFKIRPMIEKYDYIIADRFYTDIWANLLYYGYIPNWTFVLVKLLPRSDIPILLWVNPETVLKREREFPSTYYKDQAKIYKLLSKQIDFEEVNANQNPEKVLNEIKKSLENSSTGF